MTNNNIQQQTTNNNKFQQRQRQRQQQTQTPNVSMVARNSRLRSEDPLAAHATARELAKEKPDAEERRPMYQGIPEHYS